MKITNINYSDEQSGSSIAVNRISKMLNDDKIISEILVYKSKSFNEVSYLDKIDEYIRFFFKNALKKILLKLFNINYIYTINFCILPSNFLKKINKLNTDIINLHWIGNEMISINQIAKIRQKVIWTLHDMWPYTSIENYIEAEEFFEKYVYRHKKINFISKFILKKKINKFNNVKAIICTTSWQKRLCEKSQVFNNALKVLIPLPIDFKIWKPQEKLKARELMRIPKAAKVVFFNLSHPYAKRRKGFEFVTSFLEKTNFENLFFISTNCEKIEINNENVKHINFKNITNLKDRIALYSASDVVLSPSRVESFGQTALEAQACGVPVVTFKNTGSEDIVDHLTTGYCSNYIDEKDFMKGVNWCLSQNFDKELIIDSAKKKFSIEVVKKKYEAFFKELNI